MDDLKASKRQKLTQDAAPALPPLITAFVRQLESELCAQPTTAPSGDSCAELLAQAAILCTTAARSGIADSNAPTLQVASTLSLLLTRLHEDAGGLQALLDTHSLPDVPAFCRAEPTVGGAKRIATYAHKLSYTTFAPSVVLGQNLFRPPAPQDWDFRASLLHQNGHVTAASTELEPPEARVEPAAHYDAAASQKPSGVPPLAPQSIAAKAAAPVAVSEALPVQASAPQARSAFNFILNPELEEVDEDFSSSEDESD